MDINDVYDFDSTNITQTNKNIKTENEPPLNFLLEAALNNLNESSSDSESIGVSNENSAEEDNMELKNAKAPKK